MTTSTAKIFMHGRSQAVRLPKEFRLPGKECRVRREGKAVILEPIEKKVDVDALFAELDRLRELAGEPFMPQGREQPAMPDDDIDWDKALAAGIEERKPKPKIRRRP